MLDPGADGSPPPDGRRPHEDESFQELGVGIVTLVALAGGEPAERITAALDVRAVAGEQDRSGLVRGSSLRRPRMDRP
jgi:hypothetical protein